MTETDVKSKFKNFAKLIEQAICIRHAIVAHKHSKFNFAYNMLPISLSISNFLWYTLECVHGGRASILTVQVTSD